MTIRPEPRLRIAGTAGLAVEIRSDGETVSMLARDGRVSFQPDWFSGPAAS